MTFGVESILRCTRSFHVGVRNSLSRRGGSPRIPARRLPLRTLLRVVTLALPGSAVLSAQAVIPGPADDHALPWRLERLWQLGGAEDDELLLPGLFAKDIAVDADNHVYVIDRAASRIVKYDAQGRRVRSFGRPGPGPGELLAPLWVDVRAEGVIAVGDVEKGSVVRFAADGAMLPEERSTVRLRERRSLMGGAEVGPATRGRDTLALVHATGSSATVLATFRQPATRSTPPVCRLTDYPVRPVFAPSLLWAAIGPFVVVNTGSFEIAVFEGTRRVRTLTRAATTRSTSPALARRHLGDGETIQLFGMPACTVPTSLILSVAEVAPVLPAYERLALAPDGRVWASRYVIRGEAGLVDVYDMQRGYEGTIAVGAARPVQFLPNGTMLSIEADDDGVPMLVAYRLRR